MLRRLELSSTNASSENTVHRDEEGLTGSVTEALPLNPVIVTRVGGPANGQSCDRRSNRIRAQGIEIRAEGKFDSTVTFRIKGGQQSEPDNMDVQVGGYVVKQQFWTANEANSWALNENEPCKPLRIKLTPA